MFLHFFNYKEDRQQQEALLDDWLPYAENLCSILLDPFYNKWKSSSATFEWQSMNMFLAHIIV